VHRPSIGRALEARQFMRVGEELDCLTRVDAGKPAKKPGAEHATVSGRRLRRVS
jgi:hypothetical protein